MGVRGHRGADQSGIEMELYIYGGVLFFLNLSEPAAGQFFSRFGCCTNVSVCSFLCIEIQGVIRTRSSLHLL